MLFRARLLARMVLAASLAFPASGFGDTHVGGDNGASLSSAASDDGSGSERPPFVAQVLNGNFSAFPEVVRLTNGNGLCSGTFVSTRVIVTAAHCLPTKEATLGVRALSGPLGNARCEKSPRAGAAPVGATSLTAQCGGGPGGRCGVGGGGNNGFPFDPNDPNNNFGGGFPGFPGGGGNGIPGDLTPANPAGVPGNVPGAGSNAGRPNTPPREGAISVEDVKNDIAVCVIDTPVNEVETACLDTSRSTPSQMLLAGFGLANRGNNIVDDGRQRSGNFPVRQGPSGILETFSSNLQSGPNASSAPGDSGGFVGVRDSDGRLKLRAVVSAGDTVLDGREVGRAPGPVLNPRNRGVSAFVDLQSPNSLEFLRDFAQRKGVSICGLSTQSGSPSSPAPRPSPASPSAPRRDDLLALTPADVRGAIPGLGNGNFGGNFPGNFNDPRFGNFDPRFVGVGGIGNPGNFGGFGGFGGINDPFNNGFGNNGFGNNGFGAPRLVRLRNGRLAIVSGAGGFGRVRVGAASVGRRSPGRFAPRRGLGARRGLAGLRRRR